MHIYKTVNCLNSEDINNVVGFFIIRVAPDYSDYIPSKMRRKRDATQNATTPSKVGSRFIPVEANFSLIIFTTGCRSWDNTKKTWSSEGCFVRSFVLSIVYEVHLIIVKDT